MTAKFYDGLYFDLEIEELEKANAWSLGKKLKFGNEIYEDLNELAVSALDPIAQRAYEIYTSDKFIAGDRKAVQSELARRKKSDKARIQYGFGIAHDRPGSFVLYYMPRSLVQREYVDVTPLGFRYRKQTFESYHKLLNYFKAHYKEAPPTASSHSTEAMRDRASDRPASVDAHRAPYGGAYGAQPYGAPSAYPSAAPYDAAGFGGGYEAPYRGGYEERYYERPYEQPPSRDPYGGRPYEYRSGPPRGYDDRNRDRDRDRDRDRRY